MNNKRLKALRSTIDNSKLLLARGKEREKAQKKEETKADLTRDAQIRKAHFLVEEFKANFTATGCFVGDIPKRFAAFKKRLRKEIKDKDVLGITVRMLHGVEMKMRDAIGNNPPQKPETN